MSTLSEKISLAAISLPKYPYKVIERETVRSISMEMDLKPKEVEIGALKMDVIPKRYLRNIGTLGINGQIKLLESKVAVIGLGGIGGFVVEGLARLGVGHIVLVDPDVFEESNLNRQIISSEINLGAEKAGAAAKRVKAVNSSVEVEPRAIEATEENLGAIIDGVNVAADALDNLGARIALEHTAREMKIPMVHVAIAGVSVEVMSIFPEGPGLIEVYERESPPVHGIEVILGTPPQTAMFAAALEVQEVVKIITGTGKPLKGALHIFDLASGECRKVIIGSSR